MVRNIKSYSFTLLHLVLNVSFVSCEAQQTEIQTLNDLKYYEGVDVDESRHALNLVLPKEPKEAPVLIWIHGGAWSAGNKNDEMSLAKKLAEQGICVAVVGYRLSPAEFRNPPKRDGVKHPEQIKDIARAFKWIHSNSNQYGYDRNNIFVSGFSAGGHLSALLCMNEYYLNELGLGHEDIAGCIPISGAYDLPKYYEAIDSAYDETFAKQHVNGVFGSSENFLEASPVTYIENLTVPMLVLTDGAISMYADTFRHALIKNGRSDVPFIYYNEFSHGQLYRDMLYSEDSKPRADIISFIRKHTRL